MFTIEFWKATTERVIRGAIVAVSAAYFGGDLLFDAFNVNSWRDVGAIAVTGAFASLLLSLSGQALTGNGPALTNNETLDPTPPA